MLSFDIVLATLGYRVPQLKRFIDSLAAQSHPGFRLIVVDQGREGRLATILEPYRAHLELLHVKAEPGLSHARNTGLSLVASDVVTFPDDDCRYGRDLLRQVDDLMTANPQWDGVTGRVVDAYGRPAAGRWSGQAGPIDRANVWTRGASISIFLRRQVVEQVGNFDETLGLGSPHGWGSGEETDYLLRAIKQGFALNYDPVLTVFHPQTRIEFTDATVAAGRTYGMGMGRVLRKHRYSWWSAGYHVARALGGSVYALARARTPEAQFHLAVARGRALGWLGRGSA